MRMRRKVLVIIAVLALSIFIILYALANLVLLRSFALLEERETRENVARLNNALSNEFSDLDGKVGDWAFWDDTYVFVQDGNENYINLNLADSTFINLRLNFMVFVNTSGDVVYGRGFDLSNSTEVSIPEGMMQQLSSNGLLWNYSSLESEIDGVLLLPEKPVLVASKPILTSQSEGPIAGALIMGRFFDSEEIKYLSRTVGFPLTFCRFDDSQMPSDFQSARSSLSETAPVFTNPLNDDVVAGYALMDDVHANSALIIRVDMSRDVYRQGLATVNYFVAMSLAICVVFAMAFVTLLEKGMLSPLNRLTTAVRGMGRNGNSSHPMSRFGTDEVSILAQAIRDAMSQRLAAIEELAGMVGHDLRNPLTGIAGAAYYLRMKYASVMDAKGREMLKIIEDDIVYSNKIINDLLEYSRKIKLELTETTPKALAREALSLVTVPNRVQLIDLTESEPKIVVDADRLKRTFVNVIKNSVDAMPEGGTLTIKSKQVGRSVEFVFSDTGIGMTKETMEKLWTPLFTTKAKGMGFGLPITKRFIEAHGGSISARSKVGEGTTLTIALPTEANTQKKDKA